MKRFRMFAGPNGSGKSTLVQSVDNDFFIGKFINADNIEHDLKVKGFIDCQDYVCSDCTQEDWICFMNMRNHADARFVEESMPAVTITENIMIADGSFGSYAASVIAEFFRSIAADASCSFSFETVMSHSSKIDYLRELKTKGFKTYLYFICTQDVEININRVQLRVHKGGHAVDIEKIRSRYYRSLELLSAAFAAADRAFIMDSSNLASQGVFVEKNGEKVILHRTDMPKWIQIYLLDKLDFIKTVS